MPKVIYTSPDGSVREIEAAEGSSVMEVAVKEGIPGIVAECGGAAACATCHVYVGPGFVELVGDLDPLEEEMLEDTSAHRRPTSRLSCQIFLTDELNGLTVEIPAVQ
ncbi:(2Fe-2S)-binding protein [Mycolicibacterium goodii]|uniref:2Fe-2S iron-sulfur cluster-binding protein n=1 Tax=Mycolicibacterium goodii TaxID=134601 RepID=UPI001BDD142A|nr:2Fe-2S iron-sulfur cluster-binding protein [Mycolicibacterium goodii]MBU8819651.1 (2Fe-2S)-binding protein [Mycolicibacterium goodii]